MCIVYVVPKVRYKNKSEKRALCLHSNMCIHSLDWTDVDVEGGKQQQKFKTKIKSNTQEFEWNEMRRTALPPE